MSGRTYIDHSSSLTFGFTLVGRRPNTFSMTALVTGSFVISTEAIIAELGDGMLPFPGATLILSNTIIFNLYVEVILNIEHCPWVNVVVGKEN